MARYVLVEFEDNDEAQDFVDALKTEGGLFYLRRNGHFDNAKPSTGALAMFAKPTKFCECRRPSERQPLGDVLGWRVCANKGCNKPIRGQTQHPFNLLLPKEERRPKPKDYRRLYLGVPEGVAFKERPNI